MQPPLLLLLLRAGRVLDRRLLAGLTARGWPALSTAQSMLIGALDREGTSPADLSRRMGTTRQATHDLVGGLVRLDLVRVVDDPGRRRGRLVELTEQGRELAAAGREILEQIEDDLDPDVASALRDSLARLIADDDQPDSRLSAEPRAAHR